MLRQFKLLTVCVLLLASSATVQAEFTDFRGVFIDRYDYRNLGASGLANMINSAADNGITDIMLQVRATGDAYYNSNIEPKYSGVSSWDPLQTALDTAHARGVKVHAWLNSLPLWNLTTNPPAGHIYYNDDPSFRLTHLNGSLEPQDGYNGQYSSVNPVLPEVHTHIQSVVEDIATNYNVDGIHLDYIRYVTGTSFETLPHDPISHAMFFDQTGLDGANSGNASAYRNFVKTRITDLVAGVRLAVDAAEMLTNREVDLSASVWRDPDVGENSYLQDYRTWLEQDLVDMMMPMIYLSSSNDHIYFNDNLLNTMQIETNTRIAPTFGTYLHTPSGGGAQLTVSQIDRAHLSRTDGFALYDLPAVTPQKWNAIADYFEAVDNAAVGTFIDDFETDEGHFRWDYDFSPASQSFGLSSNTTIEHVTSEAQAGAGSQHLELVDGGFGDWQLRHVSGLALPAAHNSTNADIPATGYVGFWLKTEDPGITVQLAIDDPDTAELGFEQAVVADGQWHLYQWNLEDAYQWEGWVSGNGQIDNETVTIDSIFFRGDGDATIFLDSVAYNSAGLLKASTLTGDFNGDGFVNHADLEMWQEKYGSSFSGSDFLLWQQHANSPDPLSNVPEPSVLLLALSALGWGSARRR